MTFAKALGAFLSALFLLCLTAVNLSHHASAHEIPQTKFTPLTLKVLAPPQVFAGSDNAYHLVYELKMTNASSLPWQIDSLKVVDHDDIKKHFANFSGESLKKRMSSLGKKIPVTSLSGGESGIVWIHLKFESKDKIPDALIHQLALSSGERILTELGGEVNVVMTTPPVIGAPLKGEKWVAADGCCDSHRHVRALLPINGGLFTSQRYAIDWEQLGPENKIYTGDKLKVESYPCYGKDVIAVAKGTVVQVINNLPNQIPGKLPDKITPDQADGNHVVMKIGPKQYALYAHMIPGSIVVKTGQKVKKGQLLGKVGNSGNTSAPHLHFHLMDGPSPLGSNGIPYALDQFDLNGQIHSTEDFDQAEANGTPVKVHPPKFPGFHQGQYPLDQSVVHLHPGS